MSSAAITRFTRRSRRPVHRRMLPITPGIREGPRGSRSGMEPAPALSHLAFGPGCRRPPLYFLYSNDGSDSLQGVYHDADRRRDRAERVREADMSARDSSTFAI